jgi:chitin disaccharide deacetylase
MADSAPTVIITADDFGYTSPANHAIAGALRGGLVTHASLMVNMDATDEACDLLHGMNARDRIGCHLNLAEGVPLTDAMRRSKMFCKDGEFNEPLARRRFFPLSSSDKRALADETRAQIAAVRNRGFSVSHLDSHRYVHTMPNIAAVVVAVARETGIGRVRPYANCGPTFTGVKGVAKAIFNAWLASHALKRVQFFGGVDDVMWLAAEGRVDIRSIEVMTHPVLDCDGLIADGASGLLADRLVELESLFGFSFIASGGALGYDR